jgi:hypothetical protein
MSSVEKETRALAVRSDRPSRAEKQHDTSLFLKGMIVGFGLAAVASAAFGIFKDQQGRRKRFNSAESRAQSHDESGGVLGDLSNIIDESSSAFKDAVQSLDRTFESGRQAIETFQDVIDKIRE